MTGRVGVAISTTGQAHRLGFLETCVAYWRRALPLGSTIVVTVDGSLEETQHACKVVDTYNDGLCGGTTYRVGQPRWSVSPFNNRMGVAVNKNTGLELLMNAGVDHLFLSDDDAWPLYGAALDKHMDLAPAAIEHSMVMWGRSRLETEVVEPTNIGYSVWKWPRGVVLYQTRNVVEAVGGMDERFGIGGHEHAEYSTRISNAGYSRAPFVSPRSYASRGAMGARMQWHCEDMPREGELGGTWMSRKRANTTIDPSARDWDQIHAIMAEREGSTDFVSFRAHENGRASATLCQDLPSRGAEGQE